MPGLLNHNSKLAAGRGCVCFLLFLIQRQRETFSSPAASLPSACVSDVAQLKAAEAFSVLVPSVSPKYDLLYVEREFEQKRKADVGKLFPGS